MLRIIIKINNRTIYNFQVLNISALHPKSDYDVAETISTRKFTIRNFIRDRGALELTMEVINEFLRRTKSNR